MNVNDNVDINVDITCNVDTKATLTSTLTLAVTSAVTVTRTRMCMRRPGWTGGRDVQFVSLTYLHTCIHVLAYMYHLVGIRAGFGFGFE